MMSEAVYHDLDCSSGDDYDYLIKLLALGDSSVGKTSLLYHYTEGKSLGKTTSTVGVDFREKSVIREKKDIESLLGNRQRIHLQLWDTAGQERFRSLCTVFMRDAMGFLLVFDLCNEQSLLDCREWMEVLATHAYVDRPDVVLVGNKSDLEAERIVAYESARQMALELEIPYVETSAVSGENVSLAVHILLDLVMHRVEQSVEKTPLGRIKLTQSSMDQPDSTSSSSSCAC